MRKKEIGGVKVVAFMNSSYQEGFKYPPEFVEKVLQWNPEKGGEGPMAKLLHESLRSGDRLVGRFLDDSRHSGDEKAAKLYKEWCSIDKETAKTQIQDEGFGWGFSVRRLGGSK